MSDIYQNIIVALDGSATAKRAFEHALALAQCTKAKLLLVTCIDEIPLAIGGSARVELLNELEQEGKKLLAPYITKCIEQGVAHEPILEHGAPGRTLVHCCHERQCNLIAMGNRGHSGLSELMLGSVSHYVLHHSHTPVLIVR